MSTRSLRHVGRAGMDAFSFLLDAANAINNIRFYAFVMAGGFLVWFVLSRWSDDVTVSGVLAFSFVYATGWLCWWLFVLIGLAGGSPLAGVTMPVVTAALAGALFVVSACTAGLALFMRSRMRRPVTTVSALIGAHAFHVSALMTQIQMMR
jgi:hypothetical protein